MDLEKYRKCQQIINDKLAASRTTVIDPEELEKLAANMPDDATRLELYQKARSILISC